MKKSDLKVFITTRAASCSECGEDLGRRAWITLVEDKGALCLACADLDHLSVAAGICVCGLYPHRSVTSRTRPA